MKTRMTRLTTIVAAALPVIMVVWAVVGLVVPDLLGMHDGNG